jgi:hypothetical protein
MNPTVFIAIVILAFVFLEAFNVMVLGVSISKRIIRFIRTKRHGSKYLPWTESLGIAAANGLLSVGSEMIVAEECEFTGITVTRFAIHPLEANEKSGTILTVIGMHQDGIEVVPKVLQTQ